MPQKSLVLILLCAVLGLSWWGWHLQGDVKRLQSELDLAHGELLKSKVTLLKDGDQIAHLEKQFHDEDNLLHRQQEFLKNQLAQEEAALTQLRAEDNREKEKLKALDSNVGGSLADVKNETANLNDRLKTAQDNLTGLQRQLKSMQNAEGGVERERKQILQTQKVQIEQAKQTVNAQIQSQVAVVKQTRDQLKFWQHRNRDPNQRTKLDEYQAELQTQEQQLTNLRNQKVSLDQDRERAAQQIRGEAGEAKEDLHFSQAQVQEQIGRAQDEIKALHVQMDQAKGKQAQSGQRQQQLNADKKLEAEKISSIEEQIRQHEVQLQNLKSKAATL